MIAELVKLRQFCRAVENPIPVVLDRVKLKRRPYVLQFRAGGANHRIDGVAQEFDADTLATLLEEHGVAWCEYLDLDCEGLNTRSSAQFRRAQPHGSR